MKRYLLTIILVMSSILVFSQSAYHRNAHTIFGTASLPAQQKGVWITDYQSVEAVLYSQTPRGYEQSLQELVKILAFYKQTFYSPEDDSSIYDKSISLMKCASMSRELANGNILVQKMWNINSVMTVSWVCGKEGNGIVLAKI